MAMLSRTGTGLLVAGGLAVIGVMAYALSLGNGALGTHRDATAEVAVFYPDSGLWLNVRQGIRACADRGLLDVIDLGGESALVRSRQSGRLVRFTWYGASGVWDIRDTLRTQLASDSPPVAVVGSSNTALTATLAHELAKGSARDSDPDAGPILLVSSATSVLVEAPWNEPESPGEKRQATQPDRVALLDIDPGRTFRFCLNNERLANLVVGYLSLQNPDRPEKVILLVDRYDPFSKDLAGFFEKAVGRTFPDTPILRREVTPSWNGFPGSPTVEEIQVADSVWKEAGGAPNGRSVWLMLPLQDDPARRMLDALAARSPEGRVPLLRAVCGDGIGRQMLCQLAGTLPFPLWCAASTSAYLPGLEALDSNGTAQIEAEIVSALIAGLDRSDRSLARALSGLRIKAGAPAAMGRSLAFDNGERTGDDLGHVLEIRPGESSVLAHAPQLDGTWLDLRWIGDRWQPIPALSDVVRR